LTTAVEQFGRFEDTELAQDDMHKTQSSQEQNASKVEFKSVLITGKCCWEAFSR
jgi:predicted DNA-binding protein